MMLLQVQTLTFIPGWLDFVFQFITLINTFAILWGINKLLQRTRVYDIRAIYIDKRLEIITLLLTDLYPAGPDEPERVRINEERKKRALAILKDVEKHSEKARSAIRDLNPDLHGPVKGYE